MMISSPRYQIPAAISGAPPYPATQNHPMSYAPTQPTSVTGSNYPSISQTMPPASIQTVQHPPTNSQFYNSSQAMSHQSTALDNRSLPSPANMAIQGIYPSSNSVQSIQNPILAAGYAPMNPPNAVAASQLQHPNAMSGAVHRIETGNVRPSSVATNMVSNTMQYQVAPSIQPNMNQYGYPTSSTNVNNLNNTTKIPCYWLYRIIS